MVLHWTFNCYFNWLVNISGVPLHESFNVGMDNFEQLLEGAHFMVRHQF